MGTVSRETKIPLTPDAFARLTGADSGCLTRLNALLDLLVRWQQRINLVGASTLADPWRRHFLDSAQLIPDLPPSPVRIVDLGTGAGFPGLVLAILTGIAIDLVDSDRRKCAFLAEAARVTGAPVTLHPVRSESLQPHAFDVLVARAFAPLVRLLPEAANWLKPQGCCLLLKGRSVAGELTAAEKTWKMRARLRASQTDPDGVIVKIEHLCRRDDF